VAGSSVADSLSLILMESLPEVKQNYSSHFHQHFMSALALAPIFLRQKKFKPKMQVQKTFVQTVTRKMLVKLTPERSR
jgi:hypothetical protein